MKDQEHFRIEEFTGWGVYSIERHTGHVGEALLALTSSTSAKSSQLCRRAERFELLFGFGRQDKVALS